MQDHKQQETFTPSHAWVEFYKMIWELAAEIEGAKNPKSESAITGKKSKTSSKAPKFREPVSTSQMQEVAEVR
jgi:hypothetical protein